MPFRHTLSCHVLPVRRILLGGGAVLGKIRYVRLSSSARRCYCLLGEPCQLMASQEALAALLVLTDSCCISIVCRGNCVAVYKYTMPAAASTR